MQTFGITPSRNRSECRHDRTVPVRLSIAPADSVVATRLQFARWQIYRSSLLAIAILSPGYARLARQASAHPVLQSFANFVAIRARLRLAAVGTVQTTSRFLFPAPMKSPPSTLLRVADHHTYFVGGTIWGWSVWVHNANYGFKSLKLNQQIKYLHAKGINGADQLLVNMNSSARNCTSRRSISSKTSD